MYLHKVAIIRNSDDGLFHIIDFSWVIRDNIKEFLVHAVGVIAVVYKGWLFHVVLRQEAQQSAHCLETLLLVIGDKVAVAAFGGMDCSAAQFFQANFFAGH